MVTRSVDVLVRSARPADAEALVSVFRDCWRATYLGIIPTLELERAIQRRDLGWWKNAIKAEPHLLVLEVGGSVVGYASCGFARGAEPSTGEIYELYLAPLYQGMGLGEYLFESCRHVIDEMGLPHLLVWALVDNRSAGAFYRGRGGRPVTRRRERFGLTLLEKVGYSW